MARDSAQGILLRMRMQARMSSHQLKVATDRHAMAVNNLSSVLDLMGKVLHSRNYYTICSQRDKVRNDSMECINQFLHIADDIDGLSANFKKAYNRTYIGFAQKITDQVNKWLESMDAIIISHLNDLKAADANELACYEADLGDILEG